MSMVDVHGVRKVYTRDTQQITVLDGARKVSAQVMQEEADKSPLAKKVAAAYAKFYAATSDWAKVEGAYYATLSS